MRTLYIREVPTLDPGDHHPASAVRALRGICVPFDLDRIAGYLARYGKRPPATSYVAIPLDDIVAGLVRLNRVDAVIYWQDVVRPYYVAVPVACCDLEEGDAREFLREAA